MALPLEHPYTGARPRMRPSVTPRGSRVFVVRLLNDKLRCERWTQQVGLEVKLVDLSLRSLNGTPVNAFTPALLRRPSPTAARARSANQRGKASMPPGVAGPSPRRARRLLSSKYSCRPTANRPRSSSHLTHKLLVTALDSRGVGGIRRRDSQAS